MSDYTITALVDITISRDDKPKATELAKVAEEYIDELHQVLVNMGGSKKQFGPVGTLSDGPSLMGLMVRDAKGKVLLRWGTALQEDQTDDCTPAVGP